MTEPANVTTILIVDDHALFREGLREILEAQDDMVVVGEAEDSRAALERTAEKRPHVVLLDVEIPGEDVTTTVEGIHALSPESQVIILSMYEGPQLVQSLLAVGIRGYLLKSVHARELVSAIRSLSDGEARILLSVSRESLAYALAPSSRRLSDRELQVLELTAQAMSNTQIASRLRLTEATVKRHLRNIFVKLGAVSRIDAVNKAIAQSLITAEKRPGSRLAAPLRRDDRPPTGDEGGRSRSPSAASGCRREERGEPLVHPAAEPHADGGRVHL